MKIKIYIAMIMTVLMFSACDSSDDSTQTNEQATATTAPAMQVEAQSNYK